MSIFNLHLILDTTLFEVDAIIIQLFIHETTIWEEFMEESAAHVVKHLHSTPL